MAQPIALPNLLAAFSDSSAKVLGVGRMRIRQKVPSQSLKVSDNSMAISEESTAQPPVLELIFCFRCEKIQAVTYTIEPVVIGRCTAFCNPGWIGGSDVKDDL